MSENDRNEIKIREANLKELKKKLHEAKLNQMRQNKLRGEAICRIAISGSAAREPRRNEVIRIVKTLSVTIDEELEIKNFEHAGSLLAKIWSNLLIDDHPVVPEFVDEEAATLSVEKSEE